MTYNVVFSADVIRDFELIFDFLVKSYTEFGEHPHDAARLAQQRIMSIHQDITKLGTSPHSGTLHPEILPDLRHVTLGRAIVWFDVIDTSKTVRILAIFFGGQDHIRHMLSRLLR